jgi:hypothetical protein
MNLFGLDSLNVSDALAVWELMKENMKNITSKPKVSSGLDYSFITPSLLGELKFHLSMLFTYYIS